MRFPLSAMRLPHIWLISAIAVSAVTLSSCSSCVQRESLCNADLVFVRSAGSEMEQAISDATGSSDTAAFTHVAIIERVPNTSGRKDSLYVIEAVTRRGVIRRKLEEFVSENGRELLSFKRIDPAIVSEIAKRQSLSSDQILQSFIDNAKTHLGEYYDYVYMPGNGMTYCSELVYESYIDVAAFPGDCHLFESKPMNFYDADGNLPEFWEGLFDYLGVPVPQGVPGTNPEDMSRSKILVEIHPRID